MKAVNGWGKGTRLPYTKIHPSRYPNRQTLILEICCADEKVESTMSLSRRPPGGSQLFSRRGTKSKHQYASKTIPWVQRDPSLRRAWMIPSCQRRRVATIDFQILSAPCAAAATIAAHPEGKSTWVIGNEWVRANHWPYRKPIEFLAWDLCFELRNNYPLNRYLDFPDLVLRLIENGELVMGYPFDGYWQDLGRPDDYERAVNDFENMKQEFLPED
jgi:hypothetical protein